MQIKIDDFDDLGNGLGKIDNKVCFVNKGLPNEVLDIEITFALMVKHNATVRKGLERVHFALFGLFRVMIVLPRVSVG